VNDRVLRVIALKSRRLTWQQREVVRVAGGRALIAARPVSLGAAWIQRQLAN